MKKILVVVDMQNDFVDGALGTKEAQNIVKNVAEKIKSYDDIFVTYDTHFENYTETAEGRKLPVPHCIRHCPAQHVMRARAMTWSVASSFSTSSP